METSDERCGTGEGGMYVRGMGTVCSVDEREEVERITTKESTKEHRSESGGRGCPGFRRPQTRQILLVYA
jgi:hypothetical protein